MGSKELLDKTYWLNTTSNESMAMRAGQEEMGRLSRRDGCGVVLGKTVPRGGASRCTSQPCLASTVLPSACSWNLHPSRPKQAPLLCGAISEVPEQNSASLWAPATLCKFCSPSHSAATIHFVVPAKYHQEHSSGSNRQCWGEGGAVVLEK